MSSFVVLDLVYSLPTNNMHVIYSLQVAVLWASFGTAISSTQQEVQHDEFSKAAEQFLCGVRLPEERMLAVPMVLADIQRVLETRWPGCQVIKFGSTATGIALQDSDVDIFVRLNDTNVDISTGSIIEETKNIIEKHPGVFTDISTALNTLVPIVTFKHIPTRFYVDLNMKSELSERNTQVIRYLLHTDKRMLDLAIIVKFWAKQHKITKHKGFPSSGVTMLLIFYLQQLHLVPSVRSLQENAAPHVVERWNTGLEDISFKKQNMNNTRTLPSLYELLGGFFVYYNSFNFNEYIVSPFLGRPVRRHLFDHWESVPQEFDLYKRNVALNLTQALSCTYVCIQDPFVHNRNYADVEPSPALAAQFKRAALRYHEGNEREFLHDIMMTEEN